MPLQIAHRLRHLLLLIVVGLVGLTTDNPYYLQLMTFIGINTMLAVGLNMLMGYAGQISLGHAAFYGLGAYTSAILSAQLGWSPWAALPCALLLTALVAFLVGLPTLKLHGYYLAMGTLGFGIIVSIVFREWSSLTGGASGFVGIPPLQLPFVPYLTGRHYFYLVWAVVVLLFFICERIVHSRMGRALVAVRDKEKAASAVGVDVAGAKLTVFVLSAVFAALAGFLYAHQITFISPGSFGFMVSIRIVVMVVIGGMASIYGSVLGAIVLTMLSEYLHVFSEWEMVVYGLILMTVTIFLPQGLVRGILDIYERSKRQRYASAASES